MPGLLAAAHKRGLILIGPTRFFPFRRTPHHGYAPLCKPGWTSTHPRLARSRLPRYYPYLRGNRLGGQSQSSRPVRGGACFGHYALARKCRPVSLLRSLWRLSHVALISARAQQNQSYADSAPHNQMRHIICAFRRLALIWASVAAWGLSAFFHIGVGGRGARSHLDVTETGQSLFGVGCEWRGPGHFGPNMRNRKSTISGRSSGVTAAPQRVILSTSRSHCVRVRCCPAIMSWPWQPTHVCFTLSGNGGISAAAGCGGNPGGPPPTSTRTAGTTFHR